MTATQNDPQLRELIEQRQRLAPKALNDVNAKVEYENVVRQIADRELELQIAADAAVEGERLQAEEVENEAVDKRQRLLDELKQAKVESDLAYKQLSEHVDAIGPAMAAAVDAHRRAYSLSHDLGLGHQSSETVQYNIKPRIEQMLEGLLRKLRLPRSSGGY